MNIYIPIQNILPDAIAVFVHTFSFLLSLAFFIACVLFAAKLYDWYQARRQLTGAESDKTMTFIGYGVPIDTPMKPSSSPTHTAQMRHQLPEPKFACGHACCFDCGELYGSDRFPDLVLPHDVWKQISPSGDEGGLLCPNCICARLTVAGLEKVHAVFRSGPLAVNAQNQT